jgi:hypothetical protein
MENATTEQKRIPAHPCPMPWTRSDVDMIFGETVVCEVCGSKAIWDRWLDVFWHEDEAACASFTLPPHLVELARLARALPTPKGRRSALRKIEAKACDLSNLYYKPSRKRTR